MSVPNHPVTQSPGQQSPTGTVGTTPSVGAPASTSLDDLSPRTRKTIKLHLILQAPECPVHGNQSNGEGGPNPVSDCEMVKQVVSHLICSVEKPCNDPMCSSADEIINHWKNCTLSDCYVCLIFKQASDCQQQQEELNSSATQSKAISNGAIQRRNSKEEEEVDGKASKEKADCIETSKRELPSESEDQTTTKPEDFNPTQLPRITTALEAAQNESEIRWKQAYKELASIWGADVQKELPSESEDQTTTKPGDFNPTQHPRITTALEAARNEAEIRWRQFKELASIWDVDLQKQSVPQIPISNHPCTPSPDLQSLIRAVGSFSDLEKRRHMLNYSYLIPHFNTRQPDVERSPNYGPNLYSPQESKDIPKSRSAATTQSASKIIGAGRKTSNASLSRTTPNVYGVDPDHLTKSKSWHQFISLDMRSQKIEEIVQSLSPKSNLGLEMMHHLVPFARKLEGFIYETADSMLEYCEKILRLTKRGWNSEGILKLVQQLQPALASLLSKYSLAGVPSQPKPQPNKDGEPQVSYHSQVSWLQNQRHGNPPKPYFPSYFQIPISLTHRITDSQPNKAAFVPGPLSQTYQSFIGSSAVQQSQKLENGCTASQPNKAAPVPGKHSQIDESFIGSRTVQQSQKLEDSCAASQPNKAAAVPGIHSQIGEFCINSRTVQQSQKLEDGCAASQPNKGAAVPGKHSQIGESCINSRTVQQSQKLENDCTASQPNKAAAVPGKHSQTGESCISSRTVQQSQKIEDGCAASVPGPLSQTYQSCIGSRAVQQSQKLDDCCTASQPNKAAAVPGKHSQTGESCISSFAVQQSQKLEDGSAACPSVREKQIVVKKEIAHLAPVPSFGEHCVNTKSSYFSELKQSFKPPPNEIMNKKIFKHPEIQKALQHLGKLCTAVALENMKEQYAELLALRHPSRLPSVVVELELGHIVGERMEPTEGHTHDWTVFVRGRDDLPIEHFIREVVFCWYDNCNKLERVRREHPFQIRETGYAGFLMGIDVYFETKEEPRKASYIYDLPLKRDEKVQKLRLEKVTFQNPDPEFRKKLLLGGGVVLSDNPCETSSARFIQNELATSPIQSQEPYSVTTVAGGELNDGTSAAYGQDDRPKESLPSPSDNSLCDSDLINASLDTYLKLVETSSSNGSIPVSGIGSPTSTCA